MLLSVMRAAEGVDPEGIVAASFRQFQVGLGGWGWRGEGVCVCLGLLKGGGGTWVTAHV